MAETADIIGAVRAQRPLVHNITNYVAMNFNANALLALGASPAMVHAAEEVEEFVAISGSLVINIGTLDDRWVASMRLAAAKANDLRKPWVLDPVGVGATRLRLDACTSLLALKPSIVRGNAAEIMTLAGAQGEAAAKGVDSLAASSDALGAARSLARAIGGAVVVSGEADFITDGERAVEVRGGSEMITRVTAAGCALSAAVAAMLAVTDDKVAAGVAACALFKAAAGRAAQAATGPGGLAAAFLDALYAVRETDVERAVAIKAL